MDKTLPDRKGKLMSKRDDGIYLLPWIMVLLLLGAILTTYIEDAETNEPTTPTSTPDTRRRNWGESYP